MHCLRVAVNSESLSFLGYAPGVDEAPAPMTLRERKRLAAMHRIQTVALDLFDEHGFDRVTVEQIAESAEVSPSSVYRYFGSKERIVVWDEFDDQAMIEIGILLEEQPPMAAIRQAVFAAVGPALGSDVDRVHRRIRLTFTTPSIEAAALHEADAVAKLIACLLTDRASLDELHAKVYAHALVGALLGGLRHWYDSAFTTPLSDVLEVGMGLLERGLGSD